MGYGILIDTSGQGGQVGLSRDGNLARESPALPAREQAARITLEIRDLLEKEGTDWASIRYISLCSGPGSYTGLRVGYAAAKALAYVQKIPLIPISRLQLLALAAPQDRPSALWLLAREKEYFFARYSSRQGPLEPPIHLEEPALISRLQALKPRTWTRGPVPGPEFASALPSFLDPPVEGLDIDFSLWAAFAYSLFQSGESADLHLSEPDYLKPVFIHPPRPKPFAGT